MTEALAWIRRWWVLLLFIGCQIPFLLQPLGGLHKWRQADTAAVARNLALESPDPLHPRIDLRGEHSGITGMEFPLYQLMVAGGIVAAGDRDVVGKLVALIAAIAAWLALAALLVRRFQVDRISAHAALALSPLLFSYAAKVMPETTALALACVAVERTDAWISGRRGRDLALAAAALALAALVRPYVVFAGAPLLLAWITGFSRRPDLAARRPLGWDAMLAGVLAALPFLLWYYIWCPHLLDAFGLRYFFTGNPLRENLAEMARPGFWGDLAGSLLQHVVNWVALPLFALGAWLALRGKAAFTHLPNRWLVLGIPAFAVPGLLVLIGHHFSPHHYYFLVLVIPAAACVAVGIQAVRERWPRTLRIALPLLLCASMLQWSHAWRTDDGWRSYDAVLAAGGIPDAGLAAVETRGHYAWHLHPLRARGWVASRDALYDPGIIAQLRGKGLAWVALTDDDGIYRLHPAAAWEAGLAQPDPGRARKLNIMPKSISLKGLR